MDKFGTQCTAIALITMIFAGFHVDPDTWQAHHLDTVIYEGDSLYHSIVSSRFQGNVQTLLNHDDLPNTFLSFGINYDQFILSTTFGVVNNLPANNEAGGYTLDDALQFTFTHSDWSLGTFGSSTIAIFFQNEHYFVFDSHSRDIRGYVDPDGSSILLRFGDLSSVALYIQEVYPDNMFNISPVVMQRPGHLDLPAVNDFPVNKSTKNKRCHQDHTYQALAGSAPKGGKKDETSTHLEQFISQLFHTF